MRWLVRLIATFVVLAFVMVAGAVLIPADYVARLAAERFEATTGRQLVIAGGVRPSFWPTIGVRTGRVEVANAPWSDGAPLLQAEGLDIGLDLAALWAGEILIRRIDLQSPAILLERHADGRANWDFRPATPGVPTGDAPSAPSPARAFTLDEGVISNGSVTFIDRATGTRTALTAADIRMTLPNYAGPADLTISGRLNGQPLRLQGRIGEVATAVAGQISPLRVEGQVAGADLRFDGRAGLSPFAAEGGFDAAIPDSAALLTAFGQPPGAPARITARGQMTFTGTSATLREGRVSLGGNSFDMAGDLDLGGARPRLTAQVRAGRLSLVAPTGNAPSGAAAAPAPAPAQGWSTAAIDASALRLIDAQIALAAEGVDLGALQLGPTQLRLALDAGRAVFDLREVRVHGGNVTGEFVVNARNGLSVGGNLTAADVALRPLLNQLAGIDRLVAPTQMQVRFLGVGNSVAALMNSLSGEGRVSLGQGEILGLDLVGMLRRLDANYMGEGSSTIFNSMTASFTMEGGVLRNDDLLLAAPMFRATGQGNIGLGRRDLNYRLTPTALTAADGTGGVRIPVIITGPWADPAIRLDLEGLAAERLEEEGRRLEERARAEAERALQERLGVTREEGERLEDTLRRGVEEEARRQLENQINRGLRGLLGGN